MGKINCSALQRVLVLGYFKIYKPKCSVKNHAWIESLIRLKARNVVFYLEIKNNYPAENVIKKASRKSLLWNGCLALVWEVTDWCLYVYIIFFLSFISFFFIILFYNRKVKMSKKGYFGEKN